MLEIAGSELIQIFRNRLVMVSGLLIPVAVGAYLVYNHETFADLADSLPLLAHTVAWVFVAVALAGRLFRWEPRR